MFLLQKTKKPVAYKVNNGEEDDRGEHDFGKHEYSGDKDKKGKTEKNVGNRKQQQRR